MNYCILCRLDLSKIFQTHWCDSTLNAIIYRVTISVYIIASTTIYCCQTETAAIYSYLHGENLRNDQITVFPESILQLFELSTWNNPQHPNKILITLSIIDYREHNGALIIRACILFSLWFLLCMRIIKGVTIIWWDWKEIHFE